MIEPSASRFWQAALQSGLMDAEGLRSCWDSLPAEKRTADAIDRRLARQAVTTGLLTLWQAQQLVAGRSTGFKIDRYVLLELIGQGGMGRVYLARDSRLNRKVAIKILSPERVNNPRAIQRFHREAMVGAQLQHENLVRIYDEGEANGRCYLVMEFIEGKTIGAMIAEGGPLPPGLAARLARQVALGLEHAQRKGLIHRDVNPYNILVNREGVAKLTDMGLAIDLADHGRVTRDGATVGTFDYVSPEQARHSHNVDTRSDIYSLGCTLFHMLSGRVPFPSASLPEKLFGHQQVEPEPLAKLVPGTPPGLSAVVAKMLKKSPDDRYATPLELAAALEPFADDVGTGGGLGLVGDATPPIQTLAAVSAVARAAAAAGVSHSTSSNTELATGARTPGPKANGPAPAPVSEAAPPPVREPRPEPAPAAAVATAAPPAPAAPVTPDGLDLALDLGPEPSLTEGLASTRSRGRAKPREKVDLLASSTSSSVTAAVKPTPARPDAAAAWARWRRPAAAAVVALLLLVAGVVWANRSGPVTAAGGAGGVAPGKGASASTDQGGGGSPGAGQDGAKSKPARPPVPKGKEVTVVAADGTMTLEPDFRSAVRAAILRRGHVVLRNTTPLRFTAADADNVSGGRLSIRAGEGVRPVLEVEVKGRKPFLTTRGDTPLTLDGVTVVARYTDPGPDPAPVIEAGAEVSLTRCAFRVESAAGARGTVPGSRALKFEGRTLTVTGCWFENFERALDLALYGATGATLSHCMFVDAAPPATEADAPAANGWAARVRWMPGGGGTRAPRKLTVERCTVRGRGFLELAEFPESSPAQVDVSGTAVLSDALLGWEVPAGASGAAAKPPSRASLSWVGHDDLYDVRGKAWVLLTPAGDAKSPGGPPRPLPDGPADLEAWNRTLGTERDPVPPPLRFATEPAALSEHPAPGDFALTAGPGAAAAAARAAGADPSRVGPAGRKP